MSRSLHQLRVLTLSTLYPSPQHPGRGIFVHHRLQAAAATAAVDLQVVVPVSSTETRKQSHKTASPPASSFPVTYAPWNTLPGLGSVAPRLIRHQIGATFAKAIRAHRPNLLDAQFGYPDGPVIAAFARRHNLPYTITLRGSEVVHAGHYPSRRKALQSAFQHAAAVIAVSNRLRDLALSLGANPATAVCIPNGVDSAVFAPPADRQAQRRTRWSVPDDGRKLLVVAAGNLIRGKGFHHVIEAVHALLQEGMPLELIIAGPGGFEPAYEAELKSLPAKRNIESYVRFCGRLDQADLASLFGAADLFVLASEREGWPNVVHEALACGTPVVATDVGAVPDLIASPHLGRIVPNPAALQDAIRSALLDSPWDRAAISTAAHARSWSNVAAELIAVWTRAARNP